MTDSLPRHEQEHILLQGFHVFYVILLAWTRIVTISGFIKLSRNSNIPINIELHNLGI
jgi:hypothetical protein